MTTDYSLWVYFADASPVVKTVMILLLLASILSWTIIIERGLFLKRIQQAMADFEEQFWSGVDLSRIYSDLREQRNVADGLAYIFFSGFKEFIRLCKQPTNSPAVIMEGVQRSMRIAVAREGERLEGNLALLATIGSTSPYIGLFGTVWGIMTSFHALAAGNIQQASIAMVAPGISEALVATAMGLFAAIPAVIAYNRYVNKVEKLANEFDTFKEEFANILYRQTHANKVAEI